VSRCLATDLLLPESAYHFPETFVKKLVGRTDIEDALRRLETVTVDEARMAAAEALKAIHGFQQGIHDVVKVVEDVKGMIQGVDDRVKRMVDRDMVVIGASDGAGNADNIHGTIKGTGARGVENIGAAKTCQSIEIEPGDQNRSLSRHCAFFDWKALIYSQSSS